MTDEAGVALLLEAQRRYEASLGYYDETLDQVSAAVAAAGSVGKVDIGALLFWKRLRADTPWVAALHQIADQEVRRVTGVAVAVVNDPTLTLAEAGRQGRTALLGLPGFKSGTALPSAVLLAAAPDRMAVYDRWAEAGLHRLGLCSNRRYSTYMGLIASIRDQQQEAGHAWKPRDVDTALFTLGRNPG